ncbi:MAG: hypothetical protein M1833_000730 [Piccolia ochrophora]|nr:MAG: hypothetical protein M1833_000730 [Piccolia ochrophora]
MAAQDSLSDDVVAAALKKDARESSIKYSALGLQAFLPKRAIHNAPKPNTRFLRNIIKETDSHNASLLAKEAEESRARLQSLKRQEAFDRLDRQRNRQRAKEGSEEEHRHRKRRRVVDSDADESERSRRRRYSHRPRSRSRDKGVEKHRSRKSRRYKDDVSADDRDLAEEYSRSSKRNNRSRSGERDHALGGRRENGRSRRTDADISISPTNQKYEDHRHHRSRRKHHDRRASASPLRSLPKSQVHRSQPSGRQEKIRPSTPPQTDLSDSDPLETIIGPPPPPPEPKIISRGRGAFAPDSMDTRFSSSYNPTEDVRANSESEDDWDQALEALRDRQKWKQQGAERLRSAGFTKEEVEKWEKGGEKREEDVKWAKTGEGREWDRGKVMDTEGSIAVQPEWGRLKGT